MVFSSLYRQKSFEKKKRKEKHLESLRPYFVDSTFWDMNVALVVYGNLNKGSFESKSWKTFQNIYANNIATHPYK